MNKLVLRLLRQHLNRGQLVGFFLANLVGLIILLLGIQFYQDAAETLNGSDRLLPSDYLILSKPVQSDRLFSHGQTTFSKDEIARLRNQDFTKCLGQFTPAKFRVTASIHFGIELYTYIFFEAVPDEFLDVAPENWAFTPGESVLPIIIPRQYLGLYNAAFAQSQGLPQISEGGISRIPLSITVQGQGREEVYEGRIVGFSNRLNTILVPESFVSWGNEQYAQGLTADPSRLILQARNPSDPTLGEYIQQHGYQVEGGNKTNEGMAMLRLIASGVFALGLLISLLSAYLLMLSIYLLLQKNTKELTTLLLIGYSPRDIYRPYWWLTLGLNALALGLSVGIVLMLRSLYLAWGQAILPNLAGGSVLPMLGSGLGLLALCAMLFAWAIRKRILNLPAYGAIK
ncbi:MAG: ABC transporter permease [Porphyromonadaceae bacterium]|nr:ABC transporter permease [Porphyromonadaceae bacterium]